MDYIYNRYARVYYNQIIDIYKENNPATIKEKNEQLKNIGINMDSMAMELLLLYEKSTKDDTDTEDPPTIVVSPTFPTKKALYEEEKPKEPESHSTPAQVQKSIPNFE